MNICDILTPERVRCGMDLASKKRVLETLADLIAQSEGGLNPVVVFDALVARERLGSTALGQGVAIPHARIPGLARTVGAFVKLVQGVDFDAPDGRPVDLVFAMAVPETCTDEHLEALARLATTFSDEGLCERLRREDRSGEAFGELTSPPVERS
jgi:nitrogen PTS system EIIA component